MPNPNTSSVFEKASLDKETLIADYGLAYLSRQASLMGRKEVLTG